VFAYHKHGTTYAAVNRGIVLSARGPTVKDFVVPHIIRFPGDLSKVVSMRKKLHIPKSALVMCRIGGYDTFSIKFASKVVQHLANTVPADKLQFLFMGTKPFMNSGNNVHFLDSSTDSDVKEQFFKTCDVCLHARADGETFGIAVAECSVRNLPVVTYMQTLDPDSSTQFHLQVLKEKAFTYSNETSLTSTIEKFVSEGVAKKDYTAYHEFSPEKVC
jgi:hypothetical protein